MTTTRKYYAAYNHYGIRMNFGEYNVPTIHIFGSKKERDEWVDGDWNHRQEMTASEARKWKNLDIDLIVNH